MRKIITTASVLLLLTATVTYGQQIGDNPPTDLSKVATRAANFLKLPIGARALALAGGGVATVTDATALLWNPAGIASIERNTVAYNKAELYAGISHSFTAVILPLGLNSRIGISYLGLNSGDMELTRVEEPEGTGYYFNVTNTSIGVSFSQILTDRFTLGITGKWIQEKVERCTANGFGLDLGSVFNTGLLGTQFGMAIMNVGPKMKLFGPDLAFERYLETEPGELTAGIRPESRTETWAYDLPLMFRLGVAMDLIGGISTFVTNDQNRVTALFDIDDAADQMARIALSMEYSWNETVFARVGYRFRGKVGEQVGERLSGHARELFQYGYGLGVKTQYAGYDLILDYGFAGYGDLGSVSQVFLSLGF